jgi:CDGSH-type Zn-finger protein
LLAVTAGILAFVTTLIAGQALTVGDDSPADGSDGLAVLQVDASDTDGSNTNSSDTDGSVTEAFVTEAFVTEAFVTEAFVTEGFVTDWAQSVDGAYAVAGTVYRIRQSESARLYGSPVTDLAEATIAIDYHHRQNGQVELTQLGEAATVVDGDGGERLCRMLDDKPWCDGTRQRRTDDLERRRGAEINAVVVQVRGPRATHRVHPLAAADIESELEVALATVDRGQQPRCWEARALGGDQGHRWGRRAQFCFDPSTGAQVFRRIFGLNRIEVFIADELTAVG